MTHSRLALALALPLVLATAACTQGGRRARAASDGSGVVRGDPCDPCPCPDPGAPSDLGPVVDLSPQDLAPVRQFIDRRRFLLGDEVDVVASKEYFVQNLMVASALTGVTRVDRETPEGAIVTLTYHGGAAQQSVANAPRVMIGQGIEILARSRLTVRFVRTRDPATPVKLTAVARGRASTGAGDVVERRADSISIGGMLRREAAGWKFLVLSE
jgi:hypothetical protein